MQHDCDENAIGRLLRGRALPSELSGYLVRAELVQATGDGVNCQAGQAPEHEISPHPAASSSSKCCLERLVSIELHADYVIVLAAQMDDGRGLAHRLLVHEDLCARRRGREANVFATA